jgi:hypothetical protein
MKKMLKISAVLAIVAGVLMIGVSTFALVFTYQNVAREGIVTPADASIPNTPVRGPFTLKSQADIIRTHTLKSSDGKTYAEMPSKVPQLDAQGNPVLDSKGEVVMVSNAARSTWVTATTLTTALNLGIITYAFSALVLLIGLISIWTGFTFYGLSKIKALS